MKKWLILGALGGAAMGSGLAWLSFIVAIGYASGTGTPPSPADWSIGLFIGGAIGAVTGIAGGTAAYWFFRWLTPPVAWKVILVVAGCLMSLGGFQLLRDLDTSNRIAGLFVLGLGLGSLAWVIRNRPSAKGLQRKKRVEEHPHGPD